MCTFCYVCGVTFYGENYSYKCLFRESCILLRTCFIIIHNFLHISETCNSGTMVEVYVMSARLERRIYMIKQTMQSNNRNY